MIRIASAIEQVSISEHSEQERLHDQHQSAIINPFLHHFSLTQAQGIIPSK